MAVAINYSRTELVHNVLIVIGRQDAVRERCQLAQRDTASFCAFRLGVPSFASR